ncbi:MAG TPA: hypothetical protein VGO55_03040 [Allosphingosinicella sp.]|jgi:hypothetical protein|nr:hypothetical protein [Allosphingosinicella sp.]
MVDFLSVAARAGYAPDAARERDERARLYPARIREGKIERGDAETDYAAWGAIARWCEGSWGSTIIVDADGAEITLETMELAAARALQAGEAAVAKAPAGSARTARRDAVAAIHGLLSRYRAWLGGLNAEVRAQAAARRQAA